MDDPNHDPQRSASGHAGVLSPEQLERDGAAYLVGDRLRTATFTEGTVDDLFTKAAEPVEP